MTEPTRRIALKRAGALMATAVAASVIKPGDAFAAWNKSAFEAKTMAEAMKALGVANATESKDIQIRAPDIAENGAVVPIDITTSIPGTTSIAVFVEKNPFPYVGSFDLSQGALPSVHMRVKIGESSPVRVVVTAGGKHFTAAKEVKVTIGGCGG